VRAARVMATPTKRAMAVATRAAGDKEGDGEGGESDGDGNKVGRRKRRQRNDAGRRPLRNDASMGCWNKFLVKLNLL